MFCMLYLEYRVIFRIHAPCAERVPLQRRAKNPYRNLSPPVHLLICYRPDPTCTTRHLPHIQHHQVCTLAYVLKSTCCSRYGFYHPRRQTLLLVARAIVHVCSRPRFKQLRWPAPFFGIPQSLENRSPVIFVIPKDFKLAISAAELCIANVEVSIHPDHGAGFLTAERIASNKVVHIC